MNIVRFTVMSLRLLNLADNAQMVGESVVGVKCIEISDLGIDVEPQQERHLASSDVCQMTIPSWYTIVLRFRRLSSG